MQLRPNPNARYANPFKALASIARTEGFSALFRGMGAISLGAGPAHALYFAAYEESKKLLGANNDPGHEHIATGTQLCNSHSSSPVPPLKQ